MYSLLRGNRLAFPNRNPGFDPTHPAANGMANGYGASVIAASGNLIELLSGAVCSLGSSASAATVNLGPTVKFASSGSACSLAGRKASGTAATITFAAIIQFVSLGSSYQTLITGLNSSGNLVFSVDNSSAIVYLGANVGGITISAGIPYFLAFSVSGNSFAQVALNLKNGSILTNSGSNSRSITSNNSTVYFGASSASSQNSNCYMAAAMYSPAYLSLPQLLAWAADPWAFWYPITYFDSLDWLKAPGGNQYTLSVSAGSYSVTGEPDNFNIGIPALAGTYSITGDPSTLALAIVVTPGSYTITGNPDTFGITMPAGSGTYSITGDIVNLQRNVTMPLSPGVYLITGSGAVLTPTGPDFPTISQVLYMPGLFSEHTRFGHMGYDIID